MQLATQQLENRSILVNRIKLLERLRENMGKHIVEYNEAIAGYQTKVSKAMSEAYEQAKLNLEKEYQKALVKVDEFDKEHPEKMRDSWTLLNSIVLNLPVPKNYSYLYEKAIKMFEWEVNENIEITYAQFQCLIEDNWEWTAEFKSLSTRYTSN